MSPELFALDQSDPGSNQPMKQSDCYALGMVIYEVLSRWTPFSQFNLYIIIQKVMDGERQEWPEGVEGAWFMDELWGMLNQCWESQPENRPSAPAMLECLEQVSRGLELFSPQMNGGSGMDEDDLNLTSDSSREFPWFNPHCFATLLHRIMC